MTTASPFDSPEYAQLAAAIDAYSKHFDCMPVHWVLVVGGVDTTDIDQAATTITASKTAPGYIVDGLLWAALNREMIDDED